jgi:hypothetical protein
VGSSGLPFFARKVNLARVMTRFTSGFYREGSASLYVNRGLGTTGPAGAAGGVPPEIAVLVLRRAAGAVAVAARPEPAGRTSPRREATTPPTAPLSPCVLATARRLR